MQTFLPFQDFDHTANILDYRRLGKQRVEASQIITILEGKNRTTAWMNHPAVRMWRGHTDALKLYFNIISKEWVRRGYNHNMGFYKVGRNPVMPPWLGWKDFHDSHKSNLLRKDPIHYYDFRFEVTNDLPYIWPVKNV